MKKLLTERAVRSMLYKLGDSATKVAKSLQRRKIKGVAKMSNLCPLSNYLKKNLNIPVVEVNKDYINVGGLKLNSSRTVSRFVSRFDKGEFGFLEQ